MHDTASLRVTRIRVSKLFGRYTHDVVLNPTDRVTIVHGPNGIGKTVLLGLVKTALSGDARELLKFPFQEFQTEFDDGSVLSFRQFGKDVLRKKLALEISLSGPDGNFKDEFDADNTGDAMDALRQLLPNPPAWDARIPWFGEVQSRVSVHLVEAQRLMRVSPVGGRWQPNRSEGPVATVKTYVDEFRGRIAEANMAYAQRSQALDESFPLRLLSGAATSMPVSEIKLKLEDLEKKRSQLKRIGLIAGDAPGVPDVPAIDNLEPERRPAMALWVENTAKKLGVLDDIARRVEILLSQLNRKFIDKSIQIDRERGFMARTADNEVLELDSLSSGEQHQFVLLYDLLFRVKPNTLVLLDEPELSFHLTWQKSFLADLLEVVAATGFDVVLATHSPFIVGERHDLMVPLTADVAA
ncbi:MAG: AAA family ATPase [Bryobacterales bacterium]|nr:AAA family ATPase [Bryobacterales bacterium]